MGNSQKNALPKTPAGEVRHTGWRARIHTPPCESPHGSYDAVPSKEFMDIRLAQGLWFSDAEGYSDSGDDSSEEDDVRYAPPAAPCPGCTAPERVRGARGGDV